MDEESRRADRIARQRAIQEREEAAEKAKKAHEEGEEERRHQKFIDNVARFDPDMKK